MNERTLFIHASLECHAERRWSPVDQLFPPNLLRGKSDSKDESQNLIWIRAVSTIQLATSGDA
jgi:hypothetical protein